MDNIASQQKQPASPYLMTLASCRSENTRQTYARCLNNIANLFGFSAEELDWNALGSEETIAIRKQLLEMYKTSSTVNLHLSALKALMRIRYRSGMLSAEAYLRIKYLPHIKQERPEAPRRLITPDEFHMVIDTCTNGLKGIRDYFILLLIYNTGVRVDEVISLRWEHYNKEFGSFEILAKGKKKRLIFLPATLKRSFDDWRGMTLGVGPIFATYKGKMTRQTINAMITKRCAMAGVDPFSPQDLRNTYLSQMDGWHAWVSRNHKNLSHRSSMNG